MSTQKSNEIFAFKRTRHNAFELNGLQACAQTHTRRQFAKMARDQTFVRARRALGWSQQKLADAAGVHISTVVRVEKGRNVESDTIDRIIAALGAGITAVSGNDPNAALDLDGHQWDDLTAKLVPAGKTESAVEQVRRRLTVLPPPSRIEGGMQPAGTGRRELIQVPVMDGRIAAGRALVIEGLEIADYLPMPKWLLDQLGVMEPRFVKVGPNERSMLGSIQPDSYVLLDCADAKRERPRNGRIYAVNVDDGCTLKRVTAAGGILYLSSDNPDKKAYPLKAIRPEDHDEHSEMPRLIVGEAVLSLNILIDPDERPI